MNTEAQEAIEKIENDLLAYKKSRSTKIVHHVKTATLFTVYFVIVSMVLLIFIGWVTTV